jgi:hypothetical protein
VMGPDGAVISVTIVERCAGLLNDAVRLASRRDSG